MKILLILFDFFLWFVIQFRRVYGGQCMRPKRIYLLIVSVFAAFMLCAPKAAIALDLIVEPHPTDPSHFSTIQAAIDFANNLLTGPTPTTTSFRVMVEPGTYSGPITLISNVPLLGRETATTIISGSSTGALITASSITGVIIKNLTIINAAVGISVSNSTSVSITSNVLQVGMSGIAVQVQNSPSATIINNAFYNNGTAISTGSDILITNNIFSTNGTAISGQVSLTQITYNDYHNNTNIGITPDPHSIPNLSISNPDPLFVDPTNADLQKRDFHLKEGSPCIITAGNPSYSNAFDSSTFDMGAYGGTNTDTIPFTVSGVVSTLTSSTSASVSWSPNNAYTVTNTDPLYQGSYNVNFTFNRSGPPYDTTAAVSSTLTSTLISGLTGSVSPPAAPTLNSVEFADSTLILRWAPVSTATSYNVYFLDTVTSIENVVPVGNTTSYVLGGLINGRNYTITITAIAQPAYYFSVTAVDYKGHESDFSEEAVVYVGSATESARSNPITEYPDHINAYPDLPNKRGCFIATAAYGYYSAPQVMALRAFRDHYLLTNALGRAFVRWYYEYGPIGAEYMNSHPWLKPVVRAALMPAVGGALFMTRTTAITKTFVLAVFAGLLILCVALKAQKGEQP